LWPDINFAIYVYRPSGNPQYRVFENGA